MNDEKNITVSFTGHRGYEGYTNEALCEQIVTLYNEGYRIFLCGMAQGFDIVAGECVLALRRGLPGLQLRCIIPFHGQERKFSGDYRERYSRLVSEADDVLVLQKQYQTGAYHQRNNYLIDNSSVLIAYYNGTSGGTHYTVHRAAKRGLRVINLCRYRINELF